MLSRQMRSRCQRFCDSHLSRNYGVFIDIAVDLLSGKLFLREKLCDFPLDLAKLSRVSSNLAFESKVLESLRLLLAKPTAIIFSLGTLLNPLRGGGKAGRGDRKDSKRFGSQQV